MGNADLVFTSFCFSFGKSPICHNDHMKKLLLLSACLFIFCNQYAQTDPLARSLKQLNEVLQRQPEFDRKKHADIDAFKKSLATTNNITCLLYSKHTRTCTTLTGCFSMILLTTTPKNAGGGASVE